MKLRANSPSRLSVYQACARRYYYQYVIKVPRAAQAERALGIALHEALADIEAEGGAVAGVEGALQALADHWDAGAFEDPERAAAARKQAEAILRNYMTATGEREATPLWLERKLEGVYEGVRFLGIVDRVDRMPDGNLLLIDYKSGKQGGQDPAVAQQMAIYRWLTHGETEIWPAVAIHHLATGQLERLDWPADHWQALLDHAADTARRLATEGDFDPCVGDACRICPYTSRCLAFKRQAG